MKLTLQEDHSRCQEENELARAKRRGVRNSADIVEADLHTYKERGDNNK